jgi:hypothetical protein
MPTGLSELATNLQPVGIQDIQFIQPVGITNNYGAKVPTGARREWRIKKSTGELRGVVYRERNKQRKTIGWINHDSSGFAAILAEYERWQRAGRYVVGTSVVANRNLDQQE